MSSPLRVPTTDAAQQPSVRTSVAGFTATRFIANVFVRFPYVFITAIAKGLGISVGDLTAILGIRELGGLIAPLTGHWFDRGHANRIIVIAGIIAGAGCALGAIPNAWIFAIVMFIGGAAKISLDIAHNVWVGHHVPLERRARVIGIMETTWAWAFLAGVPALGWIIGRWGWQAAFLVTGPLVAFAAVVSGARLSDPPTPELVEGADVADTDEPLDAPSELMRRRFSMGILVFCTMQPFALMTVFAVMGDWFSQTLKLSLAGIAAAGFALGVAELIGTMLVVGYADRFGSLRTGRLAMTISVFTVIGVMAAGTNVLLALSLLFVMDVAVEFGFVAVLPLLSELDPMNRGKAMGTAFVLIMTARAIGSVISGWLYETAGFNAPLVASAIACAVGAAALHYALSARIAR